MRLLEEVKHYQKEGVFDRYTRIVNDFKDYDKITKVKMIEAVYKVYSDYKNIIDICTTRELKFLKMYFDKDANYKKSKYDWERQTLRAKFLVNYNYSGDIGEIEIDEEIYENIKEAIKQVDWKKAKKKDKLNEFLVSYCKIQGSTLIQPLIQLGCGLLGVQEDEMKNHILYNKVFKYYVCLRLKNYETLGPNMVIAIYNDYYHLLDELDQQRAIQGQADIGKINLDDYKSLFYNDFNMNNPVIKKFYKALCELPFLYNQAIEVIQEYALLNLNRDDLKQSIAGVPILSNYDLSELFALMDEAMDEMPSGALNGLTPNQLKKLKQQEKLDSMKKEQRYVKQQSACLSRKEVKLFYKLYFGLLDFTNRKFNIKPGYKIYKKEGLNPYDILDVIEKFWELKDNIITEFCMVNPYKFNSKEIKRIQDFKKGIRDIFVIAEYQKEYTALMNTDKVYMIKGITSNIDEIIPYTQLPYMVRTTILPFGDVLVYDSLFISYSINFGQGFSKTVENEYARLMKYYHL